MLEKKEAPKIHTIHKLYLYDHMEGSQPGGKIIEGFGEVRRLWESIWEFSEWGNIFISEFRKVYHFKSKICRKIAFTYWVELQEISIFVGEKWLNIDNSLQFYLLVE